MNREERKEKRKRDTRNAKTVFVVFLVAVVMLVTGGGIMVGKYLLNDKGKKEVVVQKTPEASEDAGEEEDSISPVVDPAMQQAAEFVAGMKLEDRVAQMFIITPKALTGFDGVTVAGETTKASYNNRPVGGMIYTSENFLDTDQTKEMLQKMDLIAKERTGLPTFLSVDEEGGVTKQIAGKEGFGISDVGNMSAIGAAADAQNAYQAGVSIGTYLKDLGFNVNYAPVADVLTNPENKAMADRSFGSDSQMVAAMVEAELRGLAEKGIYGAVKHFPGYGGTTGDASEGAVTSEKTLEELMQTELVPFKSAIDGGASFLMVGHTSAPNITGGNTPASLSQVMITDILRGQMGYHGIVITDKMNRRAITENYSADQAAVMAISAGADMILMPEDYEKAYNGILTAVTNGTLTEERINESVARIVKVKQQMGQ